ncbi:MAG: biotin--[acetyl-CoA-carboxylase] ligase [Deltaproteobacteria bacterium]|jgi:BirA family biotin operon repressor/biotin-[acetyl-CoA-carboxylase] ligase|nr:MAG: biotin--[acetyl-CoA-carboxylase] ligase [Deltaproteobacteria bacterium]
MSVLNGELIKRLLNTEALGRTIYSFTEVGSTNEVAFELARNGAPHGTVVIADSQTRGKGRLDRKWISPPGVNLYMSAVFRPEIPAREAPIITLVSSIAVLEAVKAEGVEGVIKWPNDVIVDGKKVAGVLMEMQPSGDNVDFIVMGIGVNINMTRQMMEAEMKEVAKIATSLKEVTGRDIDRVKFSAGLINLLELWYKRFLKEGKNAIIREWMERWGAKNRRVEVSFNGRGFTGVAIGVDENGYLIVRKDDGTVEKVIAGDVNLI